MAEGITHLGQINGDRALTAALDSDGDGLGEIYGCPQDWTCDDIITAFIHFSEWESLEQLTDVRGRALREPIYDAMFEEFLARVDNGEPAVAYMWTPTIFSAEAAIGEKTLWLSATNEAANTEWLDANPIAHALLQAVELDAVEMSGLLAELERSRARRVVRQSRRLDGHRTKLGRREPGPGQRLARCRSLELHSGRAQSR
ncbi:MAG: ABC-type proline/glycine betaine transport system substrate-binding protein [Verrucomicrobiales bacterium]|jgi:ABC-type proline/glycine betaine transport system substrate-binding protein